MMSVRIVKMGSHTALLLGTPVMLINLQVAVPESEGIMPSREVVEEKALTVIEYLCDEGFVDPFSSNPPPVTISLHRAGE
jgi:hypothetical protein